MLSRCWGVRISAEIRLPAKAIQQRPSFAAAIFFAAMVFLQVPAVSNGGANDASEKSVLNPEKAGRAENSAADYATRAVVAEWMAGVQSSSDAAALYHQLRDLYRQAAAAKWQAWQAYHFDDAALLKEAEETCRALSKQISALEKSLKTAGLSKPEAKALAGGGKEKTGADYADRALKHERAAREFGRLAHAHSYRSEKRRAEYQLYNATMAETCAAVMEQHWQAWRACLAGDVETMLKAEANIRVLQTRLDDYRRQRAAYEINRRFAPEQVKDYETLAVNHGVRANKCGQMALAADGDLKQIYLALAENFRSSSQTYREMANIAALRDEVAMTNHEIKALTLANERRLLWEREQQAWAALAEGAERAEYRRKISAIKSEYEELCNQVRQIQGAD